MKKICALIFMYWYSYQISGQNVLATRPETWRTQLKNKIDSMEETLDGKSQLHLATAYQNKIAFAGRTFGVQQWGGNVGAAYHHKSGFNVEYDEYYWNGMPNKWALSETGVSFDKEIDSSFYLSAGYWKVFFNNGDNQERNLFTNFFVCDANWFSPLALVNLTYYYITGNESAHRLDIALSRSFDFYHVFGADKISIEPTFMTTLATVNYFLFLSDTESGSGYDGQFKAGNYEIALPLVYRKLGKFQVDASMHYAMPVPVSKGEQVKPLNYFTLAFTKTILFEKFKKTK